MPFRIGFFLFSALFLGSALFGGGRAYALRFTSKTLKSGKTVLIVRDCGQDSAHIREFAAYDKEHPCTSPEEEFTREGGQESGPSYEGDERILVRMLTTQERTGAPYAEIWLNSNGGQVEAGIGMARTLREHGATVRIPGGYNCISSCTIAFMGGLFRYMDEGGTYQVHSASGYLEMKETSETAQRILNHPDAGLVQFVHDLRVRQRYSAIRMFYLFENTLILNLHVPQFPEEDSQFKRWAVRDVPDVPYVDGMNPERAADVARIRSEGLAALQDILMRLERQLMQVAIAEVADEVKTKTPRPTAAIRMLKAMYMTAIMETSVLSHSTMLSMGYLTDDFDAN